MQPSLEVDRSREADAPLWSLIRQDPLTYLRRNRAIIFGFGLVVIVIVGVLAAVTILQTNGVTKLSTGSGTATITWQKVGGGVYPPPQPFSGVVDGISVTGKATGASPNNASNPSPQSGTIPNQIHAASWVGTLGGTSFDLDVTLVVGNGASSSLQFLNASYNVTGTYGSQRVDITARVINASISNGSFQFSGTVGNLSVIGSVPAWSESGGTETVRASFTVNK
jgi:hypothetical protein